MIKLFCGNLNFKSTEEDVKEFFTELGFLPDKVAIILDRETKLPRGFCFVEFQDEALGREAIEATDGVDLMGRPLNVSEARAREGSGNAKSVR